MTKPTKWQCAQRILRSAWASAQSDLSLRCPHEESLGPQLPIERIAKTLIGLGGCPGWSESWLGAHSFCWFSHVVARKVNDHGCDIIRCFKAAIFLEWWIIWATSWENQQNELCAQRRLRSAWASAQSDQPPLSAWRKLGSLTTQWAHSEDSDQTGRMSRLIRLYAGRTIILLVLRRLMS